MDHSGIVCASMSNISARIVCHYTSQFYSSRQKPFGLIVAPDDTGEAAGTLYWDDGVAIGT